MMITSIKAIPVYWGSRNYIITKVETDARVIGFGEAYSVGPDEAVVKVVEDFERWLVGADPMEIERCWQLMYNGTRFPGGLVVNAAISGIEQALWDVCAKALGVPVYQLAGGKCRDRVRVYGKPKGASVNELADDTKRLVEVEGYDAIKMQPLPADPQLPWNDAVLQASRRVEAVRRAGGTSVDIGLDPHAKVFEPFRALQLAEAVAGFSPYFIEEPIRPENIEALGDLKARFPVPLATGEMLYTKFEFRDLLVNKAADIIQPDICLVGGFLEMKKIAAMAEAFYVVVAPHNPMGPLATAVNVHFAATTGNFEILELGASDSTLGGVIKEPLVVKDGYIEVPEAPGWGVEIDEEALAGATFKPWRRRLPQRRDGSWGFN